MSNLGSNSRDDTRLHSIRLSEVEPEVVSWAAPGRIPFGKLTVIEGHPGIGKSHITLEILSRASRGEGQFGAMGRTEPMTALLLTAEDGLGDTVYPRVDAAGGDTRRIWVITHATEGDSDEEELVTLPDNVPQLHSAVVELGARILIIDPLSAYLGGQINSFKDHDVRRALAPLSMTAEETGCAVVVVRHLTKAASGNAITAGGGSIGIIGAARSCLLVSADPDNPAQGIVAVVKANLCTRSASLKFSLVTTPNGYARVEWRGESEHSADALIGANRDGEEKGQLKEAIDLLRWQLRDGPVAKKQLVKLADEEKISRATLERAATRLGLTREKDKAFQGVTLWALPSYTYGHEEIGASTPPNTMNGSGFSNSSTPVRRVGEPRYLSPDEEKAYLAGLEAPGPISSTSPNSSSDDDNVRSIDKSFNNTQLTLTENPKSSTSTHSERKAPEAATSRRVP